MEMELLNYSWGMQLNNSVLKEKILLFQQRFIKFQTPQMIVVCQENILLKELEIA